MTRDEFNSLKETRNYLNDNQFDSFSSYPVQVVIAYLDFIIATQEIIDRLRKLFAAELDDELY